MASQNKPIKGAKCEQCGKIEPYGTVAREFGRTIKFICYACDKKRGNKR